MATPVAVAYISVPAWRYWDDGHWPEEWPADPLAMKVYYLYADGHFELQTTTTFTTGPAGYDNRYGYDASTPGTIGDTDYEPDTVIGSGEPRCYIEWSPSLDAEAIYDTEEDALLDVNPRRIRREEAGNYDQTGAWIPGELPPPPPWRHNSWALRVINGPGTVQPWWTDKTGTMETSDQSLHKMRPVTTLIPGQAASAAKPYLPATAGRWVTRTRRQCATREVLVEYGELGRWIWVTYANDPARNHWELIGYRPNKYRQVRECWTEEYQEYVYGRAEQKAQPAQAYIPDTVITQFGLGWNAGGRSTALLPVSGYYEFKIPPVVGAVVGLGRINESQDYGEIEHGVQFMRQTLRVVESGQEVHTPLAFLPTDTFRIERWGSRVRYLRNGEVFYESAKPSHGTVFLDTSLYSSGDQVVSPKMVLLQGGSAEFDNKLRPMGGLLADRPYALWRAEMHPPQGGLSALRSRFTNNMRPMAGALADKTYGAFGGAMHSLGGRMDARGAPPYALFFSQMYPMAGTLGVLTGGVFSAQAPTRPIESLWADRPYGEFGSNKGLSTMCPMFSLWADEGVVQRPTALPRCRLLLTGPARIEMTAPRMKLQLLAAVAPLDAVALPKPVLALAAGAHVAMAAPSPSLSIETTTGHIGAIVMTAPAARLEVVGSVETLAQAGMAAPRATLAVSGGAQIAMASPRPALTMAATVEGRAEIALAMPRAVLVLEARGETTGQIVMLAPAARGAVWADAILTMPLARLRIDATALVPVAHEAYAVNLRTTLENGGNEVTRYTAFPFNRIVRWSGRYWGIAEGGLYLIGGEDDDGEPIDWALCTGTTDFGSAERKTPAYCYVGGRLGPLTTFRVYTGEKRQDCYPYCTPRGQTAQNYRQQFGRGLNARYYAFEVSGNGELAIDDLDFKIALSARRI